MKKIIMLVGLILVSGAYATGINTVTYTVITTPYCSSGLPTVPVGQFNAVAVSSASTTVTMSDGVDIFIAPKSADGSTIGCAVKQ